MMGLPSSRVFYEATVRKDQYTNTMRLAPKDWFEFPMWFKAFVGEALPKEIFLMNQRMDIWTVEITEIGDGLYFKNGWAKFVRENSIKNGDLMVFKYEGYGMFEIVVIDDI
nr:B3 domain-containing protein REM20-like [Ipomoea batatas]